MPQFHCAASAETLRNIPMAYKLVAIVAAGIIPVVLFTIVLTLNLQRRSLIATEGNNLRSLAEIQAENVNDLIGQEISKLQVLARSGLLTNSVAIRNRIYAGLDQATVQQNLELLEDLWQTPVSGFNMVQSTLTRAEYSNLASFVEFSDVHTEILVIDKAGAIHMATSPPSTYIQGNQTLIDGYLSLEPGSAYVSQPGFDAEDGSFFVELAVPIFTDDDNPDADAVLISHFHLTDILGSLDHIQIGESGGRSPL